MKPFLEKGKCMVQPDYCPVIKACEQKAVSFVEDDDEPLGGRILFDLGKCIGCGTCATTCCGEAVTLK